ncbi:hypothetical protein ACEQ8H_008019 [Pleosporales sp. CAS-2024a]
MTIIHMVLFAWKSTASSEQVQEDPYTHGFVVEFESAEHRHYYVYQDPAHQDFATFAREIANEVKVVDYEPGTC